jgi:NAD(P)-dependent dehydrogenase (short-subunit alcohol dehydrogenase family)
MSGKLEGKVALVTGGNSSIGLATAKRFVEEGAYVFITGRRPAELEATEKEIGSNVAGIQGDVAKLADLDRLFTQIKREKGRLDIVFANAGVAEARAYGRNYGRAVQSDLRHQRQRTVVHRAESSTSDSLWRIDHPERLNRGLQRQPCVERLQRDQGRGAVVRAHVDDGFEGT